jgi:hypothetical protein
MNDRGGSGLASGTTSWTANVALQPGTNVITIGARDAAGNQGTRVLTVTYSTGSTAPPPPPPPTTTAVTLSAAPVFGSNWGATKLTWSRASWPTVDIYRNGVKVTNTDNDGLYQDPIWARGTYVYIICAPGSTSTATCSNVVSIVF